MMARARYARPSKRMGNLISLEPTNAASKISCRFLDEISLEICTSRQGWKGSHRKLTGSFVVRTVVEDAVKSGVLG
jgi:hypothetical protein